MSDESRLSPAERELETALRSLRPTTARIDVEAAARAAGNRSVPMQWRLWRVTAVAAAIAVAGGTWLMLSPPGQLPDRAERWSPAINSEFAVANEWPVHPCTLVVYRQALTKSPEELEAVLDLQAESEFARAQDASAGMLTPWNANLRSLPGEI